MKKTFLIIIILIISTIILSKTVRDEIQWHLFTNNEIQSYKSYLNKYPKGNHVSDAKKGIDTILWFKAKRINTGKSYQQYIKSQPNNHFIIEANQRQNALLNDKSKSQVLKVL